MPLKIETIFIKFTRRSERMIKRVL